MRHAPSESVDEYQRIFNAPLIFNSERNALILDRTILDEPLSFSDEHLALVHEQMLEAQLVLLQQMDVSGQVRHILLQSEMYKLYQSHEVSHSCTHRYLTSLSISLLRKFSQRSTQMVSLSQKKHFRE